LVEQVLIRIYGGSVTPDNVRELLKEKDIDGTLLGGASLNPENFCKIISVASGIKV